MKRAERNSLRRILSVLLVCFLVVSGAAPGACLESDVQSLEVKDSDSAVVEQEANELHKNPQAIGYIATNDQEKLESLTNKILQKELELLRINTYFRLETTEQSRIKPWRVFAFNIAGAGASNAGITTIAAERWQTWRNPAKADRTTLKAGPLLLLIGHSIVTAGLLTEMCFDAIGDYKRKKKGFDIRTTTKKVKESQIALDQLIMEREGLMKSADLTAEELRLETAEGQVLKDLRDLALVEYSKFYVRGIKRRISRDLSYFNGLASTTTGGYIGSLCGLIAVCDRKPRLAGPAGIGFILSGAFITTAPIINRYGSKLAGNLAKKKISKELGGLNAKVSTQFDGDLTQLESITLHESAGVSDEQVRRRLLVYADVKEILNNQSKMDAKEKAKADREFRERLLFNAAVGGTKMGWGIQLANAGFSYHVAPPWPKITRTLPVGGSKMTVTIPRPTVPHTPAQLFSKRVAAGATTYIPGTGVWIIDALQSRARGEMEIFTMGSQQALPHQKCKQRLEKLEQLEALLK